MKKLITLSLLILIFSVTYSQGEKYFYFYTDAQIKEYIELNRHNSCQVLKIENSDFFIGTVIEFGGIVPTVLNCVSVGKIKIINNVIYCYDKRLNRTYKFKQLDYYALEAMNHTAVFVKGTKLNLHLSSQGDNGFRAFFQTGDLIKSDYWKTGIKNGIHVYWYDNEIEKLFYYRNNIIIDSIILSDKDSNYKEKRFNFLKQYYGGSKDMSARP